MSSEYISGPRPLSVVALRKILSELPDDHTVVANAVENLSVLNGDLIPVGYINFWYEASDGERLHLYAQEDADEHD